MTAPRTAKERVLAKFPTASYARPPAFNGLVMIWVDGTAPDSFLVLGDAYTGREEDAWADADEKLRASATRKLGKGS